MFPRRRLPDELGALVAVHRPHHWLGWLVPAVVAVPFALLFALGPPGPLVGLVLLLMLGLPTAYILAEWFLLQHRVYEHGIVFRTELPGTHCYLVPFATVDPDRIEIEPPSRVPKGEFRITPGQVRQNPLAPSTLRFPGLHPDTARKLAKRKISWQEAADPARPGGVVWEASFRDPEVMRQVLSEAIRHAQTIPSTRPREAD